MGKLCVNENSIMVFKRELLFHSVVGQQEQPQPWVSLSPYTKLLVGDVDLFLVSFSRKKDFPKVCWHSWNSSWCLPVSGSPALQQEIKFLLKTEAEGAALQGMLKAGLLQILLFLIITASCSADTVFLLWKWNTCLHLSATFWDFPWPFALVSGFWRACSAPGRRATGFQILFVHF